MSWFKRFRSRPEPKSEPTPQAESAPRYEAEEDLSVAAEPPKAPVADALPHQAAPQPAPAVAPETSATEGWFDEEDIESLKSIEDEGALSKAISQLHPHAGREEVLFRYTLSRAVYFREFELPVLPGTAAQVMALGRNPNTRVQEYVQVIQSDPSLASAVVRLSNSTVFSGVNQCASLDQSIVRIGVAEVEKIAMLHTFNAKLFRVKGQEHRIESLVRHGIEVAFAAQALAQDLKVPAAEAFLAGLFHDAGKLVLLQIVGQVQHKLRWQAPDEMVQGSFDAFHPQVGEVLCHSWELPEAISAAVRWHHNVERVAAEPLHQSVYLGNQMAYALGIDPDEDDGAWIEGDPVLEQSGLSVEKMGALRNRLKEDLESILGTQEPAKA